MPVEEAIRLDRQRNSDNVEKAWSWAWLVVLILTPLAGGGAHPAMRIGVAGVVMVFWLTLLLWRLVRRERVNIPLAAVVCTVAASWTLLQTRIHLPGLSALHGAIDALWATNSIAVAPVYASSGAWQWLTLAAALHCGSMLFATPGRISRLFIAVMATGAVTLSVGLVHSGLGLHRLYGLTGAGFGLPQRISAPFINANQAGSLFGLAAMCGLVLWGTSGRQAMRGAGVAAAILFPLAAARMGSGSTMYSLALTYPISIFCWLVYKSLGVRTATRGMWVAAGTGLGLTLSLAYTPWVDAVTRELGNLAIGKAALWRHGIGLIGDSPWWGYGYGGTADIMAGAPFTHEVHLAMIESVPLQQVLDMGIPMATLLLLSLAVPMVRWSMTETSRSHRRTRLILLLPLLFIVLDAIVGVGLSALALALPAATITGAALGFRQQSAAPSTFAHGAWPASLTAVGVIALAVIAAPGLQSSVDRALHPFPEELTTMATVPAPADRSDFAADLPASMTLWFLDASAARLEGDIERAEQVRLAMNERAPRALRTRRLNLQHYMASDNHDLACDLLRDMMRTRRLAINVNELGDDMQRWQQCIPGDEATQTWWFEQLRRSDNQAQVLATALTAMRTSNVPWVATRAAVRACVALGFQEEAQSFALRYAELIPPSLSAAREAIGISELVRDNRAGERVLQRTAAAVGPLPSLDMLGFTLRVDEWWRSGRDEATGLSLDEELESLRISLITNTETAPDYLCLRAQIAIGLGRADAARSWLDRVLDMDPGHARAARLRASLRD